MKTICEVAFLRDDTKFLDGRFSSRSYLLTAALKDKSVMVIFYYFRPLIATFTVYRWVNTVTWFGIERPSSDRLITDVCMYVCNRWGRHNKTLLSNRHTTTYCNWKNKNSMTCLYSKYFYSFHLFFFFSCYPFHLFFQQILPCLVVYYFPVSVRPKSKVGQKISLDGL
jgi:hypothetical protein